MTPNLARLTLETYNHVLQGSGTVQVQPDS